MKISKILAGMSAAALAASMMAMAVSADDVAAKAAYEGSMVVNCEGSWWKEAAVAKVTDLIGDVKAADVSKIVFTCDHEFQVQYNTTTAKDDGWEWGVLKDDTTYEASNINFADGAFNFKFGLSTGDDKDYTIKWSVYTKDAVTSSSADVSSSTVDATSSTVAGDSSKADVTSSAAAGDSSKTDDTSKPADDSKPADTKKDVDPMTLKKALKTADGKVKDTAVVLLTELNKDGSVKATSILDGTGLTNLDVYGATFNITLGDSLVKKLEAGDWVGGGIGWNSESTQWNAAEYSWQDGVKEITAVKQADGSYNVTRTSDKAVFAGTDTYSQAWLQIYNEDDYTINSVTLLGKDGKAIAFVKNNALPDSVKPSDDKKDDNKGGSSVADGSSTTSTTSTTSTNSTGTTSSKAANNASNTNPSTGAAALAAVGVALAGAAVVATKKRK